MTETLYSHQSLNYLLCGPSQEKKNADYGNLGWDIATEKKETE